MTRRICFYVLLTAGCFTASAQFKNIKLDEVSASAQVKAVTVVVNKKNPKNMVAAMAGDIYTSFDAGVTWMKSKLTSSYGVLGDPVLLCNDKGHIFIFHSSDPTGEGLSNDSSLGQIVCQVSEDGGKTWDEGNEVESDPTKDHWNPSAALDSKDNLFLTWTKFDKYLSNDPNCLSIILFSRSSSGKKWSKPKELSQTPGNCLDDNLTARSSSPVTSVSGRIFAFWSNQNKIFLDRSYDGGDMWLSNDLAIEALSEECSLCYGMPVMMGDNGKSLNAGALYVVWPDQKKGSLDSDIWFKRSANFGDNWTSPLRINDDAIGEFECKPKVAVDKVSGYLYVVYYSRSGKDNLVSVQLAYSSDGGLKFKNTTITEHVFTADEETLSKKLNCSISAHSGILAISWTQVEDDKISLWSTVVKEDELVKSK